MSASRSSRSCWPGPSRLPRQPGLPPSPAGSILWKPPLSMVRQAPCPPPQHVSSGPWRHPPLSRWRPSCLRTRAYGRWRPGGQSSMSARFSASPLDEGVCRARRVGRTAGQVFVHEVADDGLARTPPGCPGSVVEPRLGQLTRIVDAVQVAAPRDPLALRSGRSPRFMVTPMTS